MNATLLRAFAKRRRTEAQLAAQFAESRRLEARDADALLKHRRDVERRRFTITADKDTFASLDKFFALLHHNPGHSGTFGMPFDGDGHQVFCVDPPPENKYSGKDKGKYPDQVCVAEQLYHGTPKHNLHSILKVGLVPKIGSKTKDAKGSDTEARVCLTSDISIARKYAKKDGVVLAVNDSHPDIQGKFVDDPTEKKSVMINRLIPASAITVAEASDSVWMVNTPDGVRFFKDRQKADQVAADAGAPPPKMVDRPHGARVQDKEEVDEARRASEITFDSLTAHYGFQPQLTTDAGKFGSVTRYLHPLGHNLIVTKRLKKGRERVNVTNDPGQWDHQWTFVNRSGQTTSGHTLRGMFDHFQTTNLK